MEKREEKENWYAVRTLRPLQAVEVLEERGVETYIALVPESVGERKRPRPLISRLFFLHLNSAAALEIEKKSREAGGELPPMWIYRYATGGKIQPISEKEFRLFRLLTTTDSTRCEIYRKEEYRVGDRVRVIAGPFAGYEGYARRIRRNKHIVVEIEGICAIALPYIHPDNLERVEG